MFKLILNKHYVGKDNSTFTRNNALVVRNFHSKIAGYAPTPLLSLPELAKKMGVKAIYVKDESKRFGLNAFKVLGGSYSLGKLISEYLDLPLEEIDFNTISNKLPEPLTFVTATAGNHGTGIAWAARQMGQKAVVYMPKGSSTSSVERIRNLGAECIVTNVNYDDTVREASTRAKLEGWFLVQDTAWKGYEKIPTWISEGYMTMADEALDQCNLIKAKPTHVILQAGVGAMAGGILGYLVDRLGKDSFKAIITEPNNANCIYKSGESVEGNMVAVGGNLDSIMAGLACGEPSTVTWPTLRSCSDVFVSVSDGVAATGMRISANPLGKDPSFVSGESGAVPLGTLYALITHYTASELQSILGLNSDSEILLFSTEGDTNPSRYREILWEGKYSF